MAETNIANLPAITIDTFTDNDSFLIIDNGDARRLTRLIFQEWLVENVKGEKGEQGVAGRDGLKGSNGLNGANGADGASAYQVAVTNGFVGTITDWLATFTGADGEDGVDGGNGWTPVFKLVTSGAKQVLQVSDWIGGTGTKPTNTGYMSPTGLVTNILSASDVKGSTGDKGSQGLQGVKGDTGIQGIQGIQGNSGDSAYDVAVLEGFVGTRDEWVLSLNPATVSAEDGNTIVKKIDGLFSPEVVFDYLSISDGIETVPDKNLMTDAEKLKLEGLVGSRYLGTFLTVEDIPLTGASSGSYADVDSGEIDVTTERWIYDSDSGVFVKSVSLPEQETAESVKTKYESNTDTNAFVDAEKDKLSRLVLDNPETKVYDGSVESNTEGASLGVTLTKNGTGDYTLTNTLEYTEVELPKDINGNYLLAAEIEDLVGTINLKTYVRVFDSATGIYSADIAQPLDIPALNYVLIKM